MRPLTILKHGVRLVAASCLLTACEHPIAVVTPHAEVADLVFIDSTTSRVFMRTTDNRAWNASPLVLCEGDTHTLVPQPLDFRGMPVDLVSRRDLEIRGESQDAIVAWEPLRGRGRLFGLAPGTTRVRFLVWHLTHADLVSPWLDVLVHPRATCPLSR
jgi:hypothetical protein